MAILPYNFENQAITAAGLAAAFRRFSRTGRCTRCAIWLTAASASSQRIIIGGVFRLSAAAVVDVPTTEARPRSLCSLT